MNTITYIFIFNRLVELTIIWLAIYIVLNNNLKK